MEGVLRVVAGGRESPMVAGACPARASPCSPRYRPPAHLEAVHRHVLDVGAVAAGRGRQAVPAPGQLEPALRRPAEQPHGAAKRSGFPLLTR